MLKKNSFKLVFCFLLLFLFLPFTFPSEKIKVLGVNPVRNIFSNGAGFVFALEINYPDLPGVDPPQDFVNNPSVASEDILSLYIKYFFNLAIWISGIIALGALIYGGIRYLTSTGKPESMASAKEQITAAFFGLLLLFSSYLVLRAINPELTILNIPSLKEIEIIEKRYVPPLSVATVYSSINVELPFGRIIEKIFETHISDIPKKEAPKEEKTPRIIRIKENVLKTLEIAEKLKENSEKLKKATDECSCSQTRPCCEISNPGPGCKDNACRSKLGTTSDPCKKVRSQIEKLEQDNLKQIALLKEEQQKTLVEVKDLKIELKRLKRTESFIKYCPSVFTNSYATFLLLKKSYEATDGIVREIKFWDDITIPYLNKTGEVKSDWATFLCTIGGNILPSTRALYEEEERKPEEIKFEEKACSAEIPVGEIIDRTMRTTHLLISRLEKLIVLDKTMIDAVDELQVLISQCSSQRCYSYCYRPHSYSPCIKRSDNALQYPEGPCPKSEINDQLEKIQKIFERELNEEEEGIKNVVENLKPEEEEKERIGIISLIDPDDPNSVVSKILTELDKIQRLKAGIRGIRRPLQTCGAEESEETLLACAKARGKIDPDGKTMRTCCMDELVFQECLEECYLEEGVEKYKVCLQKCLDKKSKEAKDEGVPMAEEIARCRHLLNFFCCVK